MSLSHVTAAVTPTSPFLVRPLPVEFGIAVRAAIAARTKGHAVEHYHQAKVAEDVLAIVLPAFAPDIRQIGARKGLSGVIGTMIGVRVSGPTAAALAVLWSIRSARLAGIYAVFRTSARKPGFGRTLLKLLGHSEMKRLLRRIEWRGAIQH